MLKAQMPSDRIAMGLSLACVLHCFLAPSLIVLSYGVSSFNIESELIHYLIIMLTVPISIFALTLGYKNHKRVSFFVTGVIGISVLILAVIMGEDILGDVGEKGLTLVGSIIVVYAHYSNYRTCQKLDCTCHD
tara:strand:+ start:100 stop:498 length:399 start_codon:yes stop_codon:yes gene_type:complete